MKSISLEAFSVAASKFVWQGVIDDCHWQLLGFPGAPKRGAMMRAFVGDGKLAWEDAIKKELPCLALSEIAAWAASASFPHRVHLLARVIEIAIDGLGTPVWSAYSFSSRDHAVAHFTQAISAYGLGTLDEHGKSFFIRTMSSVPRDELPYWLVRCPKLIAMQESLYPHIRTGLTEASSGKSYDDDTQPEDWTILTAVRQVFGLPQ